MRAFKPTNEERNESRVISKLQDSIISGKFGIDGIAIEDMISKKKEKLVRKAYERTHPRASGFYQTADGRFKSRNPDFHARTESELLEKLYDYYFGQTMQDEFDAWMVNRVKKKVVSAKTIEEDLSYWRRIISPEKLAHVPMREITATQLYDMFESWTGQGYITRKEFNNRKSILNGIFEQAVLDDVIAVNPIPSLRCSGLRYKAPAKKQKAYTVEQRLKMLSYLETLEQDAYTLAIRLAFHGTFRIGELKALRPGEADDEVIYIDEQMVDEHEVRVEDNKVVIGKSIKRVKAPKGNQEYSIRFNVVTPESQEILKAAKALNPDGEYLFMYEGRPMTTDTVNRRLRKYTKAVGIPYLPSHSLRFTSAAMLSQLGNMPMTDLQMMMGHSNPMMTAHYAQQRIKAPDMGCVAEVLG